MKSIAISVLGIMLALHASATVMSDEEGRAWLSDIFFSDACNDNLTPEYEAALAAQTFESQFGGFLRTTGWTRSHLMEQLGVIATNLCQDTSIETNQMKGAVYDNALAYLGKYGGTNALPVLDYVIDNCASNAGLSAFSAYVDIAGHSSEAFEYYTQKITGANKLPLGKAYDFYTAVMWPIRANGCSPAVSNLAHRLMYQVAAENQTLQVTIDKDLRQHWPGYTWSANRRRQIERAVSAPENQVTYNRLLPIQAQLNAATNLVELSTNDFLNAGE